MTPARIRPLALGLALWLAVLSTPVAAQDFKVVTTFTIIADMARNVAGDAAEVVSITKPGATCSKVGRTTVLLQAKRSWVSLSSW